MAKIYKCDNCNKIIKGEKGDISISSPGGIFKDTHFYKNFDFCANCFRKIFKALAKSMPRILNIKK